MKILLIHTEAETAHADALATLLARMSIAIITFPLKSAKASSGTDLPEKNDEIKKFIALFESSNLNKTEYDYNRLTHVVILSPLSKRWFDFLAGFACGSYLNFLIYGQEAIAGISSEFAFCFTFLKTEESIYKYFETESEVSKKQEAAREIIRAQETLLKLGVAVTGDSLVQCVTEGKIREIAFFLAAGFAPDTKNKAGVPLLHIAARAGNRESLRFLLMADAKLDAQSDDRGTSALIDSVMAKQYDITIDLIRAGADLNIKSKDGQTALVVAVGEGNTISVEALLKAGADPDISDSLGASARKYASLFHNEAMMALFEKYSPLKKE